ncbi:MAG: hypothetical protein U0223_11495, partial [Nitrospira sp.]
SVIRRLTVRITVLLLFYPELVPFLAEDCANVKMRKQFRVRKTASCLQLVPLEERFCLKVICDASDSLRSVVVEMAWWRIGRAGYV